MEKENPIEEARRYVANAEEVIKKAGYDPETKSFIASKPSGLTDAVSYELFRGLGIAFFVLTIAALVVLIILMRKYTDPEKMKQKADNDRYLSQI